MAEYDPLVRPDTNTPVVRTPDANSVPPHVVQYWEMTRQHEGMVPIAHLVMSTEPPSYNTTDTVTFFAGDQVP
jgi:hypothetical protein